MHTEIKKMVSKYQDKLNVYIGDIKNDMISTNEANITFIHAKYGFEPDLVCDYSISNLNELSSLLKQIVDK